MSFLAPRHLASWCLGQSLASQPIRLANWLVDPKHPLTSRVTVNRYWQHFFGKGIVKTSENFGIQGEQPFNPELLDWLATEFVRSGWDVMHKLIVLSSTYQQSSSVSEELLQQDPENRFLARGPRRRLSPFAIRDSALYQWLTPRKDRWSLGEAVHASRNLEKYLQCKIHSGSWRSYTDGACTPIGEGLSPPTMMAFNAAARETCIVRSDETTTPLQALTLMNNVAFIESARFLAERSSIRCRTNGQVNSTAIQNRSI